MAALAEDARRQAELARAYARYQALLAANGAIDFGDQVSLALRLLRESPAARDAVQRRFKYVLVDEFQDTNRAQAELVALVAERHRNVTVVGDDDQSIYKFRGAAISNILEFRERYRQARVVVLRKNYRSRAPILEAAYRLVRHNDPDRLEARAGIVKRLDPERGGDDATPVRHEAFATGAEEADWIASDIARRIREGARPHDVAVLVRTNAAADPVLRSLNLEGIPWRFSGTSGLYARPEVRLLLAFLRAIADLGSSVDVYALAASDLYGLGAEDLVAIVNTARRRNRSIWDVLDELQRQPGILRLSPETRVASTRLVADLRRYVELANERPAGEVLYAFLRDTGWLARLAAADTVAAEEALSNVARFFDIIRAQSALLADDRAVFVARHLNTLIQAGDDPPTADIDPDVDAVAVMTVHKAKGLEFPVVYLPGLVTGRFPAVGRREPLGLPLELVHETLPEGDYQLQEERRLCYVGMTRARDELVLSHAVDYGGQRARRVSPFVLEALDLPVADGAPGAGARASTPLERLAVPRADRGRAGAPRGRGDAPLTLSFYAVDDYLTCPLRYKYGHLLRVPIAPHHSLIYGSALHAAVAEFHRRHARGDVMSEEQLFAAFEAAWTNDGFLSREHEEARLAAGREALRTVPHGTARARRDHPRVRRTRVQLPPRRRPGPRPDGPRRHRAKGSVGARPGHGRRRPASGADVVEPTLGPRAGAGRDHRLQVVRRPRPRAGPPAGEGLAPALDLRDGLRGDDGAAAGRGRPALPRLGPRRDGPGGPAPDRQGEDRDPVGGPGHPRPRLHGQARPPVVQLVSVPRDLPVQRRPMTHGSLADDAGQAIEGVVAGTANGAVVEADNLDALRALPDGCVDLAYADPPFATGESQRLTSIRTGQRRRASPWLRRPHLSLRGRVRPRLGRRPAARRSTSRRSARDWPRSTVCWPPTDRSTSTSTGARRTTRDCSSTRCSVPRGSSTRSSGRTTTAAVHRDRWPRKHDTILWYAKGDRWLFDRDAIDRIPYLAPGLVGPEKAARGKLPTDVWWLTIVPPGSAERTGYPTQKPVRLLERIVAASSRPGDLVVDPYAGSGTTGVAAARLGRRWLLVDRNPRGGRDRPQPPGVDRDVSREPAGDRPSLVAITLDFGNTLVPVPAAGLREVVRRTATAMADRLGPFDADDVLDAWTEERERQFREEVPRFREVDLGERIVRVLARLRGMAPPPPDVRWDDAAAASLSDPAEVAWSIEVYSGAFVDALPPPPGTRELLARLADRHRLAILSNWPLAATIDRYAEAAGWTPSLTAIVVSQRVGTIKPQPAIFAAAAAALGDPPPASILHAGDDWDADVVGARRMGWRAAYVLGRPSDSPLPGSDRGDGTDPAVRPDLEVADLFALEPALDRLEAARRR